MKTAHPTNRKGKERASRQGPASADPLPSTSHTSPAATTAASRDVTPAPEAETTAPRFHVVTLERSLSPPDFRQGEPLDATPSASQLRAASASPAESDRLQAEQPQQRERGLDRLLAEQPLGRGQGSDRLRAEHPQQSERGSDRLLAEQPNGRNQGAIGIHGRIGRPAVNKAPARGAGRTGQCYGPSRNNSRRLALE